MPQIRFKLPQLASMLLACMLVTWLFGGGRVAAAPTSTPSTIAATHPSTNPLTRMAKQMAERQKRRQLLTLTRRSIDLLQVKKYSEAERVLHEALEIDPREPTNLYNMACLMSLTHRPDEAFAYLDKSALAGFTDFIHISQDTDLNSLRGDARYTAFLAKKNEYQLKVAQEAVKNLKEQFGADYLYEIDDTDKLIFATNTDQTTLDDLKRNLLRQAHAQWTMLFDHHPDQYIEVVVPSVRDYRKLVSMPGVEGYYNPLDRTLIASGLGFVTTHEFTHALHAADLEQLGQDHPIWLVEGLAVIFESTEWEKGPGDVEILAPRDNMRLRGLQASARLKNLIPLSRLFKMEQKEFVGQNAMLCYAESGSVIHYLYDKGLLRKFYDTFKQTYSQDKTARLALEKTTGQSLDDFQKDWQAWMIKRVPPTLKAAVDGPYMGAGFGHANDGLLVARLEANGPSRRAGLRLGDVLIGMDDIETRDEPTFLEVLNAHKSGDTVTLKLRRDGKYMQISMVLGRKNDPRAGGATQPVSRSRELVQ
jgi:tetratricopeptide (TPR) repeat protein